MRELLRRFVGWLFPPVDPNALAALDGGPGPELSAPDSAGANYPTGDDGADSPRTDEEIRAQIIAKLADGLDIPEEFLRAEVADRHLTPDDVAEMRRRFEYEVLGIFDRELYLAEQAERDAGSWQNQAAEAFANADRAALRDVVGWESPESDPPADMAAALRRSEAEYRDRTELLP